MFCSVLFCSVHLFCSVLLFSSGVNITFYVNRICNTCKIEIDEKNFLKDRTVCKSCYNKNRRKNTLIQIELITSYQQPKIENVTTNINVNKPNVSTYVVIGSRDVDKTNYMLRILEKIGNKRPVHIITRSPKQYPNYKTSTENKPINKYKGSDVIFEDVLGVRKSSQIDDFFTRGRAEDLDVYYISQS